GLRISVVFIVIYFSMVPNPALWGSQIRRRLDHRLLITPWHPAVQALNESDNLWSYIRDKYNVTPVDFYEWSEVTQAYRIYRYVRSLVHYTYDIDNWGVFDHAATPEEVLNSRHDDCQGISCLTVSFLIYMGYDAYVCECPFHWYIRMYYINQTTGEKEFVDFYRYRSHSDPFYIFNDKVAWYPVDFITTINMSLSNDFIARKYAEIVKTDDGMLDLSVIGSSFPSVRVPTWVAFLILFVVMFGLGALIMIFSPGLKFKRLKVRYRIVLPSAFALPALFGFLGIYFVPASYFLYFGFTMIGIGTFLADSNLFLLERSDFQNP
ncbi:MAG: hypothetical protein ACTSRA_06760, partial [Promethearchaeota archaeon]